MIDPVETNTNMSSRSSNMAARKKPLFSVLVTLVFGFFFTLQFSAVENIQVFSQEIGHFATEAGGSAFCLQKLLNLVLY